jgi:gluconolactonase
MSPFESLDPRFNRLVNGSVKLEKLYGGCRWAEGPAYFQASHSLIWSDIPNNRLMRYDSSDGHVSVFRHPANNTNGNTIDREGRLVSAEHLGRRISRTEHDGRITVLADQYQGKRFNSPNDVVVKSDGSIWFTDPTYGIDADYEGQQADSEIGASNVYRIDPHTNLVTIVCDDFVKPNGLAFSADESKLYIADTGATHIENGPKHIRVFDVVNSTTLKGGSVFAECTSGLFDGFRFDEAGHLWTSAGDGVHCYHTDGTLIGKIKVPEVVANVCFGEPYRNRLFICGTTSLYACYLQVRGVKTY